MGTRVRLALTCAALALGIGGCGSLDNPATNAMVATLQGALSPGADADNAPLQPGFGYLRVTYAGSRALFALGFIDRDQLGDIDVYYGPDGSLLRLQNGHVLSLLGTSTEWREVHLSANPDFNAAASARDNPAATFTRRRDVEPGGQFDHADTISIRPADPGARALKDIDPAVLRWFSEESSDLPPGRIAINSAGFPIYGEQWIDSDHLLTWQLWPVNAIHPLP